MKYNKIDENIKKQIEKVVQGRVYSGNEINKDFFHDEMPIYGEGKPEIVVDVNTTNEVSEVVKICYENNIPIVARGAGTGLTGASVAIHGGVIINMATFNNILEYDEQNLLVTVEPGVLLNQLQTESEKRGYLYPPDPGEKSATIGGNVSTNAGGMRAVKYSTTRAYVREIELVLPTGEITTFGSKVSKSSSGYSLLNLIIGSEGTLGIITKIVLKILPLPKYDISIIIPYEDMEKCLELVPELSINKLEPQSIEFTESETIEYSEKYTQKFVFPKYVNGVEAKAYLIVRFDGNDEENILKRAEKASKLALRNGALEVYVADNDSRKKDLWTARGAFLEAIEAQAKLLDECDVVVPVSEVANYIKFVNSLKNNYDFKVVSFGHAGDGNLHIYALSNDLENVEEFKKQVDDFMNLLYEKALKLGGQISGEHGIGNGKRPYFKKYENEVNLELMRSIKKVFDPKMILNPSKIM
ncbi:FAD-binding oxidoreductase [Oceanivirga salmonicida]|uniref:FAD-binding oxidoreductase n=1 Tax=Oceanivirga salmonicida TaxID=1769291 RepID=UPI00082B01C3|nr:FAD-linked oxidase C-terminal domain-containing protein [Oceanivirga salmonicida]